MRKRWMIAMLVGLLPMTAPVDAQRPEGWRTQMVQPGASQWDNGRRWGYRFNNRWIGGWRAPGGWSNYRPPVRGWAVPSYWLAEEFRVGDFGGYGLSAPAQGYDWYRYYDDAILVDPYGRVRDSVSGVDWGDSGEDWVDIDQDFREDLYAQGYYDRAPGEQVAAGAPYPVPPETSEYPPRAVYAPPREMTQAEPGYPPARYTRQERGAPYPLPPGDAGYDQGTPPDYPPVRYADRPSADGTRTVRNTDGSTTVYHPDGTTVTTSEGYVEDGWYYPPTTTTVIVTESRPMPRRTVTERYVPNRRAAGRR